MSSLGCGWDALRRGAVATLFILVLPLGSGAAPAGASTAPALPGLPAAAARGGEVHENAIQLMDAFDKNQGDKNDGVTPLSDHIKRLTMFALGVPLLILVLTTGTIGIAMGVYGKPWFVAHMICAGLTMTLALVHAVVALAWFYPF